MKLQTLITSSANPSAIEVVELGEKQFLHHVQVAGHENSSRSVQVAIDFSVMFGPFLKQESARLLRVTKELIVAEEKDR